MDNCFTNSQKSSIDINNEIQYRFADSDSEYNQLINQMKSIVNSAFTQERSEQHGQNSFQTGLNQLNLKRLQQLQNFNKNSDNQISELEKQLKQLQGNDQLLSQQIEEKQSALQKLRDEMEGSQKMQQEDEAQMQQLIGEVQKITGVGLGIPEQEIEKLLQLQFDGYGQSQICLSCYKELSQGTLCKYLPCSHIFHSECINAYLKVNKVCPGCGQQVII